jgi:hypothetical protein
MERNAQENVLEIALCKSAQVQNDANPSQYMKSSKNNKDQFSRVKQLIYMTTQQPPWLVGA